MIQGREIVFGITGGIAAYKAAELVRLFIKKKAKVTVLMTEHASRFITPLTLESLSGRPVYTEMFARYTPGEMEHIALADLADVFLVAPATANLIGKAANGLADDFLSTVLMATTAPKVLAPAMNVNMWHNPVLQKNLAYLKSLGYRIVEPEAGDLACGYQGVGRLAPLEEIEEEVMSALTPQKLQGKKVLVTAGPTREHLDPIRFLSNPSSGKMGFALARVARRMGAEVTLVHGPTQITPPRFVNKRPITSAEEMARVVFELFPQQDIVIKCAAVADFRPESVRAEKIKKKQQGDSLTLNLVRNPDILAELGKQKTHQFLVGFAAETTDLIEHANQKLKAKNLDLIVANDVRANGAGFETETNAAKLLYPDGKVKDCPLMSKEDVADDILNAIVQALKERNGEPNSSR